MFTDIIKSDALRRGKSIRPGPGPVGGMAMSGVGPPPNVEQMMQILGTTPGMTPELLRTLLEDRKNKMATQPVFDPRTMVAGANYRNPL